MREIVATIRPMALVLLALLLVSGIALPAAASSGGGRPTPVFVTPPAQPTPVATELVLVALSKISPPEASFVVFEAELYMALSWLDPRLAHEDGERRVYLEQAAAERLDQIWWPDVALENAQGERRVEKRELQVSAAGLVTYSERFSATFSADLDLARFPFDTQHLEVRASSFGWDRSVVKLVPGEAGLADAAQIDTVEWRVEGVGLRAEERDEIRSPRPFSQAVLSIDVARKPGYYLGKIVLPLVLIVLFNGVTFWMPGESPSSRMERSVVVLLTVVAFQQVVAATLPRIGAVTFLDAVIFLAYAAVGLIMASNLWAQARIEVEDVGSVQRVDRVGRWVYPLLFAAALFVLWLAYRG